MKVKLKVWRQRDAQTPGAFQDYDTPDLNPNMSFLEMLDVINQQLIERGEEAIAFDHDCREGICGTCSLVINGKPHGPHRAVATCQTYMRSFKEGDTIVVEPFRAKAFPLGEGSRRGPQGARARPDSPAASSRVRTGSPPDANALPVPKEIADLAMDAAQCIGCGACVAVCKNASAMLFVAAKVSHFNLLPQGQPERFRRARAMVNQMDAEGFGACTVTGSCEAVCPKGISLDFIAKMNRDYGLAFLKGEPKKVASAG
jgi:succinate dehydrogenase / fumarate reductase iron-sulfur subunit